MENIETLLAAVAQTQGFDDDEPVVSTATGLGLENSESSPTVQDGSGNSRPSAVVDVPPLAPTLAFSVVERVIGAVDRKKRGRPKGQQLAVKPPPPKRCKREDEEEDVCFICFDGGSLVLCDRKGCPKAYHPACIKRDEAFFKSKAKWNCGWHICSVCRKVSHYLCYTCTYSLCKGCTKDADYLCVRGNKGFCSICMKTIMLIENKDQANNESVDFDDQTSWEYLFKVYWVILKEKLSLTLDELTQAKKPWKGVATVGYKPLLSNAIPSAFSVEVPISYNSTEHLELNKPHVEISLAQDDGLRTAPPGTGINDEKLNNNTGECGPSHNKDTTKPSMDEVTGETNIDKSTDIPGIKEATHEPGIEKGRDEVSIVQDTEKKCICKNTNDKESGRPEICSSTEWATKDLLEFIAHMKNGDTSAISQFDVQTLLLDYIKRNNLRDPRRKSQIICDQRLKNLFGKPRVGHIEMLKLLEFHFLIKQDSKKNTFIPAGFVSSAASEMEVDGNTYGLPMPINSRKRKTRKKSDERAPQNNLNEYAAIDAHNINLIYLRRNLMENLIGDHENFNNKVIGSIVRIRISSNDQKQDVHRLVQVVGTTKVGETYKIGDNTADVMLEVLNLDKNEVVSIDAISNQEFTEDECGRLRQSIRCGLVKQFTVGEVQNKAMALQPVRVNDWLEAEISRLNHLRDRASENGRKKDLREYVNKLQLLKSPDERSRRISEIPEIHADPKMSPNYESEEDTKSGDNSKKDEYVRPSYSGVPQNGRKPISPNKKDKEARTIQTRNRVREKTDASGSSSSDKHMNQVNITNSVTGGRNDQAMQRSGLKTASVGNSPSSSIIETEKLWHYRDPNGKIQGPFSMMQLRKWSTTGLFPPDMRIWTNHEQYDSLLLTDALNGQFHLASDLSNSGSWEKEATEEIGVISEGTNLSSRDSKQTEPALGSNVSVWSENITRLVQADESGGSWPQCWDLLKDDNNSDVNDVQARDSFLSSTPEKTNAALSDLVQESENGENNSTGLTKNPIISGHELQNQSNNEDHAGLPSEENLRSLNIDLSSNNMECGSVYVLDLDKPSGNISVLDLPSPMPKTVEIEPPDVPMQNFEILELLSPTPRSNNEDQATETKQSGFTSFPLPNSNQVWSSVSSLGLGEVQLPEVDDEWCGYSPTPAKPSMMSENVATSTSNIPNWLMTINGTIELDAFGEESVSDLLAEVDAMESQGALPSPTSAIKFARELMEDCKDDCFSSIEEFSRKSDALSSTGEIQLNSESSSMPCNKPMINTFDFLTRSSVHSSASSEGETNNNAPFYSGDAGSEYHPHPAPNMAQDIMVGANVGPGLGSENVDPGWGTVQGNINLVTVQGNVNLVLGGPAAQGMANLGWGTNQGTGWVNPNLNPSPRNGSLLPWGDGQRKYGCERFSSPREWGGYQGSDSGFGRGRPPWGRQPPYGGGGYSRPIPKGQRVCKFYGSGHCRKGAFCDYLHP